MTPSIKSAIERMKEVRTHASNTTWFAETSDEMNCLMRNDPETEHYFYADGCVEEDAANFKFCAYAANHWLTILTALERAVEALEYYNKHESVIKEAYHSNESGQITCVHTFINHEAKEVLAEIAAMLEGK